MSTMSPFDMYDDNAPAAPTPTAPANPAPAPEPAPQEASAETPAQRVGNVIEYKSEWSEDFPKEVLSEVVALPSMMRQNFLEQLDRLRQSEIVTDGDRLWLSVGSATDSMTPGVTRPKPQEGKDVYDLFERALADTSRQWAQRIESVMAAPVKPGATTGKKLTGRQAVQAARQIARLGTYFRCPLYHTGGQLVFSSPSDNEILNLIERMTNDLEELGRRTSGMFLSSEVAYLQETLMDFALAHVDECTIAYDNYADLKAKINFLDIPHVIWGVAGAIWSKGFRYMSSCMADHTDCRHVAKGVIDLRRIQRVDTTSVPIWALHQVLSRTERESVTPTMLARYRDENPRLAPVTRQLVEGIEVELHTCSSATYFESSRRWITELEETYVDAMQVEGTKRYALLSNHAQATAARQYAHMVKAFILNGQRVEERDDIEQLLNTLSASDEFRQSFFRHVEDYLDNSTISLLGLSVKNCPSCGRPQVPANAKRNFPGIVPVNVARLFFYLFPQKGEMIRNR